VWAGKAVHPVEDRRFVIGKGLYLPNASLPRMAYAAVLRSIHPHARIASVDARGALEVPGVFCALTGEQAARLSRPLRPLVPLPVEVPYYCLAHEKVRYVGEPVAAVAAESRYVAEDALERIRVEYEPLAAAVDPEAAMGEGAPLVFERLGTNLLWHDTFRYGDVEAAFRKAAHVVRERFAIHRYASTPLETFGCIAHYDEARGELLLWTNDQRPGQALPIVAAALGLEQAQIRLVSGDIGGGFGNKRKPPYLVMTALLSKLCGRPVQFVEDRRENLMALVHACNGVMEVEVAASAEGRLLALRVKDIADEGCNVLNPTVHSLLKLGNITNCYEIPAVEFDAYAVLTNKCPSGANRGIGKPFMCFALERMMEEVARRLGRDSVGLRRQNLVPPERMPYTTPTGSLIDSGDFPATLERLLELIGYEAFRDEQKRGRQGGRWLGLGLALAVEPSTSNQSSYILTTQRRSASGAAEAAMVRVESDGSVRVVLGDVGSGQGHQTAAAQIVADELAVGFEEVRVSPYFDSLVSPWLYTTGNYSNKFAGTDVGAIQGAARKVREKLVALGAHLLGVAPAEVELAGGAVRVKGDPARRKSLAELAQVAYRDLLALPAGMEPGLEGRCYYRPAIADLPDAQRRVRNQLFVSHAGHAAIVEVDVETGAVSILKYAIVHDCGRVLNPVIVEGLVHGATAHGIGAALYEEFVYDEEGRLLTTTFVDYLKPTAAEVPDFVTDHLESPSPFTPLGMKGVGEGGAIPAPAAIVNAVEDALAPLGARFRELPLKPERVWRAIREARAAAPAHGSR
jgi:2-furoyl-CoA dehydrogenase large subunit